MLSIADDPQACYLALTSRDARFDGQFFTAVTSTKIYCRPVCRVKAPRQANCLFFAHAAQAENAGFRPCLRCRPELAPGTHTLAWSTEDASNTLALQALQLLRQTMLNIAPSAAKHAAPETQQTPQTIARVARRLGISERHLGRIMQAHLGIAPLQYLQTQRLLAAKTLLTDTQLPMQAVADAAGFGSLRAFNAAFVQHYRLPPSRLRQQVKEGKEGSVKAASLASQPGLVGLHGKINLQLGFRPPYAAAHMWKFWHERQLNTMELIANYSKHTPATLPFSSKNHPIALQRSLRVLHQGQWLAGWLQCTLDLERNLLCVRMSEAFAPALPLVISRLRSAFDLDADPSAIDAALGERFAGSEGMRVPGSLDGFEIAVRAILGQQVTVAAGRTLTQRVLQTFGEPVQTPWQEISRCFPTPQALAHASPESLGALGIVKQRQAALIALSQAVASGALDLNSPANPLQTIDQLKALPGIGNWTAHYIAMRALRWPDAFPAGDIALHNAMGLREIKSPTLRARQAEDLSQAWRPWRGYAVLRIWAGHGNAASEQA